MDVQHFSYDFGLHMVGSFYKLTIKRERQKQVPQKLLKSSQVPKEAPIKKGTFRTSSQAPRSGETSGTGYQNPGSGTRATMQINNTNTLYNLS